MARLALPMVDTLAVAGTEDECRERLGAFEGVVDRVILGNAWVGPSEERIEENFRSVMAAFGPGL
jgi:hypothetical protein